MAVAQIDRFFQHLFITQKFADEKIEEAEEKRNEEFTLSDFIANTAKAQEFKEVTVERINESFYLICGENEVFILNDGDYYSRL